jgi:hypothetical protein
LIRPNESAADWVNTVAWRPPGTATRAISMTVTPTTTTFVLRPGTGRPARRPTLDTNDIQFWRGNMGTGANFYDYLRGAFDALRRRAAPAVDVGRTPLPHCRPSRRVHAQQFVTFAKRHDGVRFGAASRGTGWPRCRRTGESSHSVQTCDQRQASSNKAMGLKPSAPGPGMPAAVAKTANGRRRSKATGDGSA